MKKILLAAAVVLAAAVLTAILIIRNDAPVSGDGSPVMTNIQITPHSDGSEASQYVLVNAEFDRKISVKINAKKDFDILLNGKPLDKDIMEYSVTQGESENSVQIKISALPSVNSPGNGQYFALYNGDLSITAKDDAVPNVTDDTGHFAAKWSSVNVIIPSGLILETVSSTVGNTEQNIKASVTIRVVQLPQIRVISWIKFNRNGMPVMDTSFTKGEYSYTKDGSFPLHNHEFLSSDTESCAKDITEGLNNFFGEHGEYSFSYDNDTVTITAVNPKDNEQLSLDIVEN